MKESNILASIDSIESMGLVDGPGIRTVIFFNGCSLRCKYCHNPEMWQLKEKNVSVDEIVKKVLRNKPYYNQNGGVTYSGGEPLLQQDFLIELSKRLKEENIHICLDTAGVGLGNYEELLKYIDIVLLDIKHVDNNGYNNITGGNIKEVESFIKSINKLNKTVWIRQVIIPDVNDNYEYIDKLNEYLKKISNVKRIDFLPFHRLGIEKYQRLNIDYPYKDKNDMDKKKCEELYNYLIEKRHQDGFD